MKGAEYRIGTIIEAAAELKLFNVCSFKTPLLPGQAPTTTYILLNCYIASSNRVHI